METVMVSIAVEVPTPWWDYLVGRAESEEAAKQQLLRAGGVTAQWREIILRAEQERTGEAMDLSGMDLAHEQEIERLKALPDRKKPRTSPPRPPE
jgi:hypothetical protein